MPIPAVAAVLCAVLFASSAASGQTAERSPTITGSGGMFAGALDIVGTDQTETIVGGWLDIRFKQWALGQVELDFFQNRRREHRDEACPVDDCSERYERDAEGRPQLIHDPRRERKPATESQRFRAFSVSIFKPFGVSRRVAPHYVVGFGRLTRHLAFNFDDPELAERKYRWKPWGPVAGLGVDIVVGRLAARLQYRIDPMFVGQECVLICNTQFRAGVGWIFARDRPPN